jgi:hypothetical protein
MSEFHIGYFCRIFPHGMVPSTKTCARLWRMDCRLFVKSLLSPGALAVYDKAIAPSLSAYLCAKNKAHAECDGILVRTRERYEAAVRASHLKPANTAYKHEVMEARMAYDKAIIKDWNHYHSATGTWLHKFDIAKGPSLWAAFTHDMKSSHRTRTVA